VGFLLLLVTVVILAVSVHMHNHAVLLQSSSFGGSGHFIAHVGDAQRVCLTSECAIVAGRLLANMDPSADPCEDFYRWVL
jgi:hypothetical protein